MTSEKHTVLANSLTQLTSALGFSKEFGVQLSQTATLIKNNRNYFVSNDRTALTFSYTTHGIVQTMIDQPVEDAFRGGIVIKSRELDADDIQKLQNYMKEDETLDSVKELAKWVRLYGGGGIVINAAGKSNKPLNINQITEDTLLEFYPADLWELQRTNLPPFGEEKPYVKASGSDPIIFYYGQELSETRLIKVNGKKAPSFARPQLRGWGMSEIERLIRSFNQYLKNQDLIFELLDEAKVDVYGIKGFNTALMQKGGTEKIQKQIELTNTTKNFQNAVVKDKEDDYEQKQMNFAGLSEMLQQIRIGIANDLRMPLTKIFGQSAAGFASGEDDIENYNAMIESEIRGKYDNVIIQMLKLICQKLFGFVPEDLQIEYIPLRMMSAEQEENVKTSKLNNLNAIYDRGLITAEKYREEINQQNLLAVDLDDSDSLANFPTPPPEKPKLDLEKSNSIINKIFKRNGTKKLPDIN